LAVSTAIDNVSLNAVPAGLQQAVLFVKRELEEFLTIEENIEEESKDMISPVILASAAFLGSYSGFSP